MTYSETPVSVSGSFFIKRETEVTVHVGNVSVEVVSLESGKTLPTVTLLFSVWSTVKGLFE